MEHIYNVTLIDQEEATSFMLDTWKQAGARADTSCGLSCDLRILHSSPGSQDVSELMLEINTSVESTILVEQLEGREIYDRFLKNSQMNDFTFCNCLH